MRITGLGLTTKQENGVRCNLKVEALTLGLNSIYPGKGTLSKGLLAAESQP